jgi:hypothetical protein
MTHRGKSRSVHVHASVRPDTFCTGIYTRKENQNEMQRIEFCSEGDGSIAVNDQAGMAGMVSASSSLSICASSVLVSSR